ncbi:TPA: hypothetical protein N0F65_012193 [Lagenidium giganteum]|uniref:Calcineurin-like phosphoesterase domain-containing protein n=1 Tax=Lagenidium giganteum TaxID=4803 RepID=A0AAV2ZMS6_9STRA|nr:TPA: hypothetical protein N0F65_012193 [Lagenidium giganteum]
MRLLPAILNFVAATNALATDPAVARKHWVVTDVQITRGTTTQDDTLDACTQQQGWLPVGVNWADENAQYTLPLIAPLAPYFAARHWASLPPPPSFTFLCVQYKLRDDLQPSDRLVRDVAVYHRVNECPARTEQLFRPRPDTVVCVEYDVASVALPPARYVVDLVTTSELYYNHEDPSWRTQSLSVHMRAPRRFWSDRRVFLSVRRPVRPIVGVRLVMAGGEDGEREDPLALFMRCGRLDGGSGGGWERAGAGFVNDGDRRGLLCVKRLTVGSDGNSSTGTASERVLEDVQVVARVDAETGGVCPDSDYEAVVNTSTFLLCGRWQRLGTLAGEFVTDVALHRTQTPGTMAVDDMPGNWTLVSRHNVNDPEHIFAAFFMTRRSNRRHRAAVFEQLNMTMADAESAVSVDEINDEVVTVQRRLSAPQSRPPLCARMDGSSRSLSFRVLQISDLHLSGDPNRECVNPPLEIRRSVLETAATKTQQLLHLKEGQTHVRSVRSDCSEAVASAFIDELLEVEQPDLVVFSGDNVEVPDPAYRQLAMHAYSASVEARGIPWAMIFGNHDMLFGFPLPEMMDIVEHKQYAYVYRGPAGVAGLGNYELNVQAPVDGPWGKNGTNVFRMYFLDSHGNTNTTQYPRLRDGHEAYDWVHENQIEFYRSLAEHHEKAGDKVPAIMFLHIPLPEFHLSTPSTRTGTALEKSTTPRVNSGLFSTLIEVNDVKAAFVGHDHMNDYCYQRQGIQLCYCGVAGFGIAYARQYDRRARVIEWTVDEGNKRSIRSWQRRFQDPAIKHREEVLYAE